MAETLKALIDPSSYRGYESLVQSFSWRIPERFNAGAAVLDNPDNSTALVAVGEDGGVEKFSFGDLRRRVYAVAAALREFGVGLGDRVAIHLLQGHEFVTTLLATYLLGAVAVTIPALLGAEAVEYRVRDSGAKALVVDGGLLPKLRGRRFEGVEFFVVDGEAGVGYRAFEELLKGPSLRDAVDTGRDDPAHIFYTSGTEGPPKGAVHAHRWLIAHIPCFQLAYDLGPREGDVFWTPADWAWIGGCGDLLLPALYFGCPVVAVRRTGRFDPAQAYMVLEQFNVTCAFMPPTALRLLRKHDPTPLKNYELCLRAVMSGGEPVTGEVVLWGRDALKASINETYGQTEANLLTGNSAAAGYVKPGSIGKPVPGHFLEIVDDMLNPLPLGEVGHIALRLPDPVAFLGYWNNPQATARKMRGGYLFTGDLGWVDGDGFLWFKSRADDLIKSSGYRLSPWEIEQALNSHPAVEESAVIGVPDPERHQAVKAYVVLKHGFEPGEELIQQLRQAVREKIGPHATPREIEFVNEIPRTATLKIKRSELRNRS
jgi:acetyl-CoA synthetase